MALLKLAGCHVLEEVSETSLADCSALFGGIVLAHGEILVAEGQLCESIAQSAALGLVQLDADALGLVSPLDSVSASAAQFLADLSELVPGEALAEVRCEDRHHLMVDASLGGSIGEVDLLVSEEEVLEVLGSKFSAGSSRSVTPIVP